MLLNIDDQALVIEEIPYKKGKYCNKFNIWARILYLFYDVY